VHDVLAVTTYVEHHDAELVHATRSETSSQDDSVTVINELIIRRDVFCGQDGCGRYGS